MRVLILSSNNGGGHNAAASALRDAIAAVGGESETLDCVSLISPGFSRLCSRLHSFVYCRFPHLFRAAYRYTEKHSAMFRQGHPVRAILGLGKRRLARRIREGAFDSVLCTHVFAALMLTDAVKTYGLSVKTGRVETDYTVTPGAEYTEMDLHFVPSASVGDALTQRGIPRSRILVSGMPVRSQFRSASDTADVKRRCGIAPAQKHLLLMCGSMGCGQMERVLRLLAGKKGGSIEVSVVCGTNRGLFRRMRKRYGGALGIHVYGQVENISQLMDSADLLLTKSGGMSVSEAAAKGLPMVLSDTVGGCEAYNQMFWCGTGGAVSGKSAEELTRLCLKLLDDEDGRKNMRAALLSACLGSGEQKIVAGLGSARSSGNTAPDVSCKRKSPTRLGGCLQAFSDGRCSR